MKNGLTKEHSKMLYGVAIVLMVVHHLFCIPAKLNADYFSIFGVSITEKIAWFCKICVAIYAFISGYAIYQKCHYKEGEQFQFFKRLGNYCFVALKQILGFMKKYWIVFAIFVPLGFIIGELPEFSWDVFWNSLFGFESIYNSEWWYVKFYIIIMSFSPFICITCDLIKKVFPKKIQCFAVVIMLVGGYFLCNFIYRKFGLFIDYYRIFFVGYLVASFNIFKYFSVFEEKKAINIPLCLLILAGVIFIRVKFATLPDYALIDPIIIVPFIYAITYLLSLFKPMFSLFSYLGKYSVYMWLTHTFYCYYYFQTVVTFSGVASIMFLTTMALAFITALAFSYVEKSINGFIKTIGDKRKKEILPLLSKLETI